MCSVVHTAHSNFSIIEIINLLTYQLVHLCVFIRYTAGMVWFNEQLDKWLQLRQTVMKVAPVSMTTHVNNHLIDNKVSSKLDQQQQQQQHLLTDVTASGA